MEIKITKEMVNGYCKWACIPYIEEMLRLRGQDPSEAEKEFKKLSSFDVWLSKKINYDLRQEERE